MSSRQSTFTNRLPQNLTFFVLILIVLCSVGSAASVGTAESGGTKSEKAPPEAESSTKPAETKSGRKLGTLVVTTLAIGGAVIGIIIIVSVGALLYIAYVNRQCKKQFNRSGTPTSKQSSYHQRQSKQHSAKEKQVSDIDINLQPAP